MKHSVRHRQGFETLSFDVMSKMDLFPYIGRMTDWFLSAVFHFQRFPGSLQQQNCSIRMMVCMGVGSQAQLATPATIASTGT